MKKIILLIVAIFAVSNLSAREVTGDTTSINGIKVIRLNGTHSERGYTYGKLLANEIYDVYYNYFREKLIKEGVLDTYPMLLASTLPLLSIDERTSEEIQAIIEGIQDSEIADQFNHIWGRPFSAEDIIFANMLPELFSKIACSSLISWGESTMKDPELLGELIITRHLDWEDNRHLYNNHLITAHNPSEDDEQRWVSFGFAGMLGALSGANDRGVGAFLHAGNIDFYEADMFEPIVFTIRKALERKDLNGDKTYNTKDVWDAINGEVQGAPFIIDVVGARKNLDSAFIIECSGKKKETRTIGQNSNLPGTNLVATNHFRVLGDAEVCPRYDYMQYILLLDSSITIEKSWYYLMQGAGLDNNLQVIQYMPASNDFQIGFTDEWNLGWNQEPVRFNFNELFRETSVADHKCSVAMVKFAPNPANILTQVNFSLTSDTPVELELIASSGSTIKKNNLGYFAAGEHSTQLDLSEISAGVYFIKISTNSGSLTNKIVVAK